MKILLIEDEPKTGDYLRQGLREAGFTVDLVQDGLDGLHLGVEGDQDLIILDVMLPRMDGWGVLQALMQAGVSTPVIFLTARDQVEERVRGLELGAAGSVDHRWHSGHEHGAVRRAVDGTADEPVLGDGGLHRGGDQPVAPGQAGVLYPQFGQGHRGRL